MLRVRCLRQLLLIPHLQGKLCKHLGYLNLQPLIRFVLPALGISKLYFSVFTFSVLKTPILFAASCFLISFCTKPVHLSSGDLGFSSGQGAGQKVAELQGASAGVFQLRREVILLFILPFFFKRQQTVIETKLQQLVKHLRTSTRFYPALIFRLQLLQINARPQMVAV